LRLGPASLAEVVGRERETRRVGRRDVESQYREQAVVDAFNVEALIYVPVLIIAGEFDTWSFPEDREGLMRDLMNAPLKRSVLINEATHFVLFEKKRFELFEAILAFLKEMPPKPS
jgi:pimeloyl-ACP methyl ester carboxylesterase